MLKHSQTYEIMRPEMVGVSQSRLVLGKHSGRHAFKTRLKDLGYNLDESEIDKLFERFKTLADKKKTITDTDLEALLSDTIYQPREIYALDGLQVVCGTMGMPTATVRLTGPDGKSHIQSSVGTGPVDAAYKAIDAIIGNNCEQSPAKLLEFVVHSVTEGIDAIGEVTVRIAGPGCSANTTMDAQREDARQRTFGGYGADTDIVVASAKAYLSALNKVLVASGNYGPAEKESAEVALHNL
jgi:2-isopropylmalate synthase